MRMGCALGSRRGGAVGLSRRLTTGLRLDRDIRAALSRDRNIGAALRLSLRPSPNVSRNLGRSLGLGLILGAAPLSAQDAPRVQAGAYAAVENVHSPFARVAEIVSPSVVFIEVRHAGAQAGAQGPFDEFFRDAGTARCPAPAPASSWTNAASS